MQTPTPNTSRYHFRKTARRTVNVAANPPDERTPFDPSRFPDQRQNASPFDLPPSPPAPVIEQTSEPTAADVPAPRRRGRPRKNPFPEVTAKVGYDPNPTVIDDPPECDESVAAPQTGRKRQRASVGTPAEVPDRSGVRDLPERMFTPCRATEIEATPMPDFPLSHDGDEPVGGGANVNTTAQNLQSVSSKFEDMADLDGEDFDMDQNARNLRTVSQKTGKKRETDPQSFRLPSRSAMNGTETPVRRRRPSLPEAPVEPEEHGAEKPRGRKDPAAPRGDGRRYYYDDGALCGWLTDPAYGNAPMGNDREQFHCISIIGQIEGHSLLPEGQKATKYEHIIPTLVSVEEDDRVDGLLVILNTMGGDVEAGLAIAEMIASMTKPTVSLVLGGGHSIGVPLATAAKYSLIVPSATMTIHPVRVSGMVIGVPQSFRYMSEMQERITKFICSHSKASPEDIRELMMRPDQIATDCGSILEGNEAVRYGIIDEVGGLDRALEVLREMCGAQRDQKGRKQE